jgi:hypothetical protein
MEDFGVGHNYTQKDLFPLPSSSSSHTHPTKFVGDLEEEKSMIHNFTVTFGAKYLTGMVTSVPLYETFSHIENNILHQSKNYKNHFENSKYPCSRFK